MPYRCIVYGCRGNTVDGPKVSCFSFPSDEDMRKKWLKVLPLKHDTISRCTKVCELHFNDSDFVKEVETYDSKSGRTISFKLDNIRLKKDAVPSRFSEYLKIDSENFKGYLKKHQLASETENFQKLKREGKEDPDWGQYIKSAAEMTDSRPRKRVRQSANLWQKDEMSALIALYELEPCLYDRKDPNYQSPGEKNNAYHRIQQVMINIRSNCTVSQIKYQIQKIRSQYSNEKLWKNRSICSGSFTEETYKPSLWCYRLLHFLDEHIISQERYKIDVSASQMQYESSKDSSTEDKQYEHMLFNPDSSQNGKQESSKVSPAKKKQYENMLFTLENFQNRKDHSSKSTSVEDMLYENMFMDSESARNGKDENTMESEDEDNEQCENFIADSTTNYDSCLDKVEVSDAAVENYKDPNNMNDKAEVSDAADKYQEYPSQINDEVNNSRKRKSNDSLLSPKNIRVEENVHTCNSEKDDIFGQYIAEEMKALREKPFLYARTKQSILLILTKANFQIQNLNCS